MGFNSGLKGLNYGLNRRNDLDILNNLFTFPETEPYAFLPSSSPQFSHPTSVMNTIIDL